MEEGLPKIPKLELAQWKYILSNGTKEPKVITENLIKEIDENSKYFKRNFYKKLFIFFDFLRYDSVLS